ncbi:MAG: hypothetical protein ACXWNK_00990 [Vulcanimicrobiaceae bacterium]
MNEYISAAMLGAGSGMRTTAAPFAARWKRTGTFPVSSAFALAGELVVDKLPFTGARTKGGALGARMSAAGFATRSLAAPSGIARLALVAIAALAAYGTAYAMMNARKAIVDRTGLPDALVAIGEDALAVALVLAATRSNGNAR